MTFRDMNKHMAASVGGGRWGIGFWGRKQLQVTVMAVTKAGLLRTSSLANSSLWVTSA